MRYSIVIPVLDNIVSACSDQALGAFSRTATSLPTAVDEYVRYILWTKGHTDYIVDYEEFHIIEINSDYFPDLPLPYILWENTLEQGYKADIINSAMHVSFNKVIKPFPSVFAFKITGN